MKPPNNSSSSSSSFSLSNIFSLRKTLFSPYLFTFLVFILFFTILYEKQKDFTTCLYKQAFQSQPDSELQKPDQPTSESDVDDIVMDKKQMSFSVGMDTEENEQGPQGDRCDVFSGKWVWDESNQPMYEESECPYIQPQLTCQKHGRPDKGYQNWRWQPHGCSLPSFNATFMLEKLRGKRMLFIGDSLNRGQYISMVCLLHGVIPKNAKSMKTFGSLTVFRAKEYNATIEFYWAPFLLESNSDDAVIHRVPDRIIRKGSIYKHGRHWEGADIFVFNTYLWWMTGMKMKILQGESSFEDDDKEIELMETEDAYRMTMKSMIKWIEHKVDPKKSRVFFTSMSPYHEKAFEWGGEVGGNCYNETTPIGNLSYWGRGSRKGIMEVIKQEFKKSKIPITFVNITQLSEYRKDAHTSIYKKHWNPLTTEQLANPKSYSDCVHWCLPGLQDTWNELLFTKLFYPYLAI